MMALTIYFIILITCCTVKTSDPEPLVEVQQGWLRGEKLDLSTGDGEYFSFKGIQYGQPPIGERRFMEPLPALPWNGTLDATRHGNVCPQVGILPNEDCLYLNVYTRDLNPGKPQTVMFFIHGGGFNTGSGNSEVFGPDLLMQRDVVVVTINYRLEALGFLCMHTAKVPGNAGLKDQALALKWVQENIAQFGGDPNSVTVFGESAGGASTALHVLSPMSSGLFQRAIVMSGVPTCEWATTFEPRRRAFALGKLLGCETKDSDALLACLQSLPVEKLINVKPILMAFENVNDYIRIYFAPVVEKKIGDDNFLTETPVVLLKNSKVNKVDIMLGHTSLEGMGSIPYIELSLMVLCDTYRELFVPRKITNTIPADKILPLADDVTQYYFGNKSITLDAMKEMVNFISDFLFNYDIIKFMQLYPKNEMKKYLYKISTVSERNLHSVYGDKYNLTGVGHAEDLMYLFDVKAFNVPINRNATSYKMIEQTTTLFTNFAKCGIPTPDDSLGAIWKEYDRKSENYLDINEVLTPGNHLDKDIVRFWNTIYQKAKIVY